ncbi:MAG: DegV family EDD domain-containing protein [Defluviitaleaceae bacterium]|nr:DegV family EDD domain-containing protein [Defluviitaleaceae bacterium]
MEKNLEALYLRFRSNHYRRIVEETGIREGSFSAAEAFCVELIYLLGKPTVSDFAGFLGLSVPNANYKINSLVKKGYVVREQSKRDLREQLLCVTDKFLSCYNLNDDAVARLMQEIRGEFSASELAAFNEMLLRVIDLMQKSENFKIGGNKMIKIITDTASDITAKEAAQLNVHLMPISVIFGNEPYDQLADENFSEFYKRQAVAENLPTTSLISPGEYLEVFEKARDAGETLIVIPLSSKLSGSFQSAELAKNMAEYEDIHLIDAKQVAPGQRICVELAARLRDEGKSAQEIVAAVTDVAGRTRLFACLDTLKYLVKGGRISKTAGFMGSMLSIKPIICVEDGAITAAGKAKGREAANKKLLSLVTGGFDPNFPVIFAYSANRDATDNFAALATEALGIKNKKFCAVGGVIGAHTGPNTVAVSWVAAPGAPSAQ